MRRSNSKLLSNIRGVAPSVCLSNTTCQPKKRTEVLGLSTKDSQTNNLKMKHQSSIANDKIWVFSVEKLVEEFESGMEAENEDQANANSDCWSHEWNGFQGTMDIPQGNQLCDGV
ncbi:hypothetical protein NC652_030392 [Populus alba x Populus x berolinensis]|nr:hypothetical protein NC652_030392 [Populus alba x Populus x berolinensis]